MKKSIILKKKQEMRASALSEIRVLLDKAAKSEPNKAKLFVAKAYKLVLRTKIKLPNELKRKFCKYCKSFWIPGKSVRVRLAKGKVVLTCLSCKRIKRILI